MAARGVKDIRVRAIVEVCPPPRSEAMAFWVAASKSVGGLGVGEGGYGWSVEFGNGIYISRTSSE